MEQESVGSPRSGGQSPIIARHGHDFLVWDTLLENLGNLYCNPEP